MPLNAVHVHEYRHYGQPRCGRGIRPPPHKDLPVIIREIETRQPYVEGKDMNQTVEAMKVA